MTYEFDVATFGAAGDGVTDDRPAIQAAIDAARAAGGGDVRLGPRRYLIGPVSSPDGKANGIVIPFSADENDSGGTPRRVRLLACRSTSLLAGGDDMIVIRISDCWCAISGFPTVLANGHGGVWALGLVPDDMLQTAAAVSQCFNEVEIISRDTDEGVVLCGGPTVDGRDSGCWYNRIHHYHWGGCRGRWLKPSNAAPTKGVCNGNEFRGRVSACGAGMHIQAGGQNIDYSHYEGIERPGPFAVSTAIKVDLDTGAGPGSAHNESNKFIACRFEANTLDFENANPYTEIYGCNLRAAVWTALPTVLLGGYGASMTPQVAMGLLYQMNNQVPGFGNGHTALVGRFFLNDGGGFVAKRAAIGVPAGDASNVDIGGYHGLTTAGGGSVMQDFEHNFDRAGLAYLAISRAVSTTDSSRYAIRASVFLERSAGMFLEVPIANLRNTIANHSIQLTRVNSIVRMVGAVYGGLGGQTAEIGLSLVRIA